MEGPSKPNQKEQIRKKINQLESVVDEIPGVVIIHQLPELDVVYISQAGQRFLGCTLADIQKMGQDYYNDFFNPEDFEDYAPKVQAMLEHNNPEEVVSYFQQVRGSKHDPWSWHFSTSKILMRSDEGKPLLSITISLPVDPEKHVTTKLERLFEDFIYHKNHKKLFLNLTTREREILSLLAQSKSAPEIAELLIISTHTVETHRKNLRKKLNINSIYELGKFARAFDLI